MEQDAAITTPAINSNKPKGEKGWKIATAIVSIVAVCGIGFGVYGVIQSLQKDGEISDKNSQIIDRDDQILSLKNQIEEMGVIAQLDSDMEQKESDTNLASVSNFESFSSNLIKKIKSLDDTVQFYKQETKTLDLSGEQFRATIDKSANLVLMWDNYRKQEVLAENVIDFEFVVFGNGMGTTYLYYINQDGSVSKTEKLENVKEDTPAITNNIGNYKGVVSIQTTHGNYPYGTDGFYASFTDFNGDILSE